MSPTKKGKYECKKNFRIYVLCTIISDKFFSSVYPDSDADSNDGS